MRPMASLAAPRSAGLALVALCACDSEPLNLWLGLPPATEAAGAATLVIGAPERSGARVFIADLRDGPSELNLNLQRQPDDDALEAAYFTTTIDEAGLEEGWIANPQPNSTRRPLAVATDSLLSRPAASFRARIVGEPAEWLPTDQLSAAIAGYEVEIPETTCERLEGPRLNDIIGVGYLWSVQLSSQLVLLRGDDLGYYIVTTPSGDVQLANAARAYTAGTYDEGWVYLGDGAGRIWRGQSHPTDILEAPQQLGEALGRPITAISARGAEDLFAVTNGGEVHHFDGEDWTLVETVQNTSNRMIHIGPSEALLTSQTPGMVLHVTTDRVRVEAVANAGILSLADVPEIGVLCGTSDGELMRREDGQWRTLGDTRYGWFVISIVPYQGEVVFLLASGTVGGYRRDIGHCQDLFNSRFISRGGLIPQEEGLLMLTKVADVSQTQAVLLEPLSN